MNDRPNLNEGKPWSEMDLVDFRSAIGIGRSVMDIADFLCRSEDEVRERIAEPREGQRVASLVSIAGVRSTY
jgi:hypothetical protein